MRFWGHRIGLGRAVSERVGSTGDTDPSESLQKVVEDRDGNTEIARPGQSLVTLWDGIVDGRKSHQ